MALQTIEAPGGFGLQVMCPNCSKMHDAEEYPLRCKRCNTPMDDSAVKDVQAKDTATPPRT